MKIILLVLFFLTSFLSSGQLKVAIIQYSIQDTDIVGVDDNRFVSFAREAATNGAKLIVGPETLFYRYEPWKQNGTTILDLANKYDSLVQRFSNLAKELNIFLVIGLREPSNNSEKPVYNTALFIGDSGKIMGKHRKMNPSNNEKSFTKAGSLEYGDATPFETSIGKIGMLICKDMDNSLGCNNCPPWDLTISENKMDLFIGLNGDKSRGWAKVVRGCKTAGCYGIGANLAQNTWDENTAGNSGFVNKQGEVINEAGLGEKIIYQEFPRPIKN